MNGRKGRYPRSEVLLDEAMQATGLSDFGPGDFREGLDVLLESLARDGDLSPAADAGVIGDFRRRLVNRLEVEAWYRDHPEVAQLTVRGPVDINGLPRTGTTAIANMMSLDPQFRCLRGWEQSKPCPPPTLDGEATDPRRLQAAHENEQLSPELKAMHLYDLDATMEDTEVLGMAFHGQQYTLPVFGYHASWRDADPAVRVRLPPARREAAAFATPAGPLALQGSAPQLPPGSDRGRLSRRALRHDAPRPRQGGAVLGEHRVNHLPGTAGRTRHAKTRVARCPSTYASAWRTRSQRGRASEKRASSTCITAS